MSRSLTDLLFSPRSIAIVGGSSDPEKISGRPVDYLRRFGYSGALYVVNPRHSRVQDLPSFSSIADIPETIDLAVVVVPAEGVVAAIQSCADAQVGAAIVFASGFAETNEIGIGQQEELLAITSTSGMRILGPNCLGSFTSTSHTYATFSTAFDTDGSHADSPVALVTQSGAVGTFTFTMMNSLGLGVRYFANTGNQVDITTIELLNDLLAKDDVRLLLGHLENLPDLKSMEKLAESVTSRDKPLIILKAGSSSSGARAIAAHTASVAGDDVAFSAVVEKYGGTRVGSMEEMADAALLFVTERRSSGQRLTIVTMSGGAGALAADDAVRLGLLVEPWSDDARHEMAEYLPYYGSTANPIDVTGSMINDIGILTKSLEIAGENNDTDLIMVVLGNADREAESIVTSLKKAYSSTAKPFVVSWTGGSGKPREELLAAGVPTYRDPSRAVRALSHLSRYCELRRQGLSTSKPVIPP